MSDKSFIKISNGSTVTADTNFANKATIENFLETFLGLLKSNSKTSDYFSVENSSDYEVNVLPVSLKDTTAVSSEILTDRRNFAGDRAEIEARKYASKFYDTKNKDHMGFYKNHMAGFIDKVKSIFYKPTDNGNIRIVSQTSFLRVSQAMVNIMLRKKPDGTDNLIRRRKVKPDEFTIDSKGNKVHVYYSDTEIEEAEKQLYIDHDASGFLSLDVSHLPFGIESCLLSAVSLMVVDRSERSGEIDEQSIEDIFTDEDEESPIILEQYSEILNIAKRDLGIIDLIESRNQSGNIIDVIHADCTDTPIPVSSSDKLTMREKYTSLMLFVRVIIIIIFPLIEKIRLYGNKSNLTKNDIEKIIGIDDSEDDNYMKRYNMLLEDNDFREFLSSLPVKYRISERMFTILLVSLVKRATVNAGVNAKKIVDAFANHIGYRSNSPHYISIRNFFGPLILRVPETAVEDINGLISTIDGKREPMVSYAYRNVPRYLHDNGMFGIELAVIDSCVNIVNHRLINSRKQPPTRYNMSDNTFTFNVDSLVETVSKIMAIDNLTDSINPFAAYKAEIIKKNDELDLRRQNLATILDETYGISFPAFFVDMPPIPYNNSERIWAAEKCIALEEQIRMITDMIPSYDWETFRSTFRNLDKMVRDFASSEFEDPNVIETIRINQEMFDDMCKDCNLSSDNLSTLKKLENDLRIYSNLDNIRMEFVPFKFDFKKSLGTQMNFYLNKTYILYNNSPRTVQSLINNPEFEGILSSYFRPFFEPYATINTDVFDITFTLKQRVNQKSKNKDDTITDIVMTVNFGSSDDVHVASKFRTRFPCILNTKVMLDVARQDAGKHENDFDFTIADMADKFIIKWDQNREQNLALSSDGKSVLKLIASTRGCYEQYPAYDSNMMNIIISSFKFYNDKYVNALNLEKENEKRKNKPKPVIGFTDEFGFGIQSKSALEQIDKSRSKWDSFALTSKGLPVDTVQIVNDISNSNQPTYKSNTQDARSIPFGGNKRLPRSRTGPSNFGRSEGSHTVENTHGKAVIQEFTRERSIKKWALDSDGYRKFTYEKKTITSYVKVNNDKTPQEIRERRELSGKTPKRHQHGVRPENSNRNRHATGMNGKRNGTPNRRGFTPNASKATPIPRGTGSTSPFRGNSNSASPAARKHGFAPGAASPSGFEYLQPDHDNINIINHNNMYPGAASPAQGQSQIFQEVEIPHGIFHAESSTPNRNNTSYSQASGLASSVVSNVTPVQDFVVNEDDDFEI